MFYVINVLKNVVLIKLMLQWCDKGVKLQLSCSAGIFL